MVRRIVRAAGHRYLGTLTFPGGGVHDYATAAWLVQGWAHHGGGRELLRGDYVMVPELHPGGHGWHWHFTTGRRVDATVLRLSWTRWLRRNADQLLGPAGTYARVHLAWRQSRVCSSYLGKYVAKTFATASVPPGRHRYRVGESTLRPEVETLQVAGVRREDIDQVEDVVRLLAGTSALGVWIEPNEGLVVRWEWQGPSPPR